ncbi:CAP domain-containing protein [Conexibacter sp. SYSU D00693]|uniref:CAP domain-containing protein n=1 Tax=Conexibacter sp. SYSU D00693 TaxID=2812560 RepID=UPI00196AFBA7|nr:CAP domain-containing protein [Conexibacter sp. SYSU D00693]
MPHRPVTRSIAAAAAAGAVLLGTTGVATTPAAPTSAVASISKKAGKVGKTSKVSPRRQSNADCNDADLLPTAANLGRIRSATLCLLNKERRAQGRTALSEHVTLRGAATSYAREMVAGQFFAHDAPSGSTMLSRLKRTTYLKAARTWAVGENLAWGSGELATPRRTVAAWMASPGHKRNILDGRFRHIGIGIVRGAPVRVDGDLPAATYVTEFGVRG